MNRCPECGQFIETERDKANRKVFVWTFTTVFMIGSVLPMVQWSVAYWTAHKVILCVWTLLLAGTIYEWVRFVRVRRRTESVGDP